MDWRAERAKGCVGKTCYGQRLARVVAERLRAEGVAVTAYRCPWGETPHWHLGHVPSIDRLHEIADAIRARAQDPAA